MTIDHSHDETMRLHNRDKITYTK